jgi:hypothetical protein
MVSSPARSDSAGTPTLAQCPGRADRYRIRVRDAVFASGLPRPRKTRPSLRYQKGGSQLRRIDFVTVDGCGLSLRIAAQKIGNCAQLSAAAPACGAFSAGFR